MATKAPLGLPSQSTGPIPECAERGVGDAEIAVEDQPSEQPDHRVGRRQRDHQRDAGDGAHHAEPGLVQQQREDEAEPDLERHHAEKEEPCAAERLPERRVGEDGDVIVEADEGKAVAHRVRDYIA